VVQTRLVRQKGRSTRQNRRRCFTAFTPTAVAVTPTLVQNTLALNAAHFIITSLLRHRVISFVHIDLNEIDGTIIAISGCAVADVRTRQGVVHFEGFALDPRTGELCQDGGKAVRLPEQPFRILLLLLERPKEVVTRE